MTLPHDVARCQGLQWPVPPLCQSCRRTELGDPDSQLQIAPAIQHPYSYEMVCLNYIAPVGDKAEG